MSEYTELEAAFRAAKVAHQFLLKPCDAYMLRVAIDRAFSLQSILSGEALAGMVGSLGELPSAPRLYVALTQALADPDSSMTDIAGVVEQDVAISAKILQLVNSAFFGLSRNVSSVQHAVSYLGVSILQSLVLSVEAFRVFTGADQVEGFSIDEFDEHSQLTAGIARKFGLPEHLAEPAVVASLLHDIGKLVVATRAPGAIPLGSPNCAERRNGSHFSRQRPSFTAWGRARDRRLSAGTLGTPNEPSPRRWPIIMRPRAYRIRSLTPWLQSTSPTYSPTGQTHPRYRLSP